MKRILWMAVLLAAAAFGSRLFGRSDVAKLEPVEVIRVSVQANEIVVETDTGQSGRAETLEKAFENLKHRCPGDIFLDTADYVVLTSATESKAAALLDYLRPACRVSTEKGSAELTEVADYLAIHVPEITLMECQQKDVKIPKLVVKEGAMELVS